ncbi:MAG: response regulator [Cyanothece sp. SIO1E1]|nr:response regulator [Cyanothece sp. SIO1E1]
MRYHLRYLGFHAAVLASKTLNQSQLAEIGVFSYGVRGESTVQAMLWLMHKGLLDIPQVLQLIENLSKEALESFLWLNQGECHWVPRQSFPFWESAIGITPTIELPPLIQNFQQRLQAWRQINPKVSSPHQRPYLFVGDQPLKSSTAALAKLAKLLRGWSIRQLALILKKDELKVGKLLYPYMQSGEIYLREPRSPFDRLPTMPLHSQPKTVVAQSEKNYKIACLDDSPVVLSTLDYCLNQAQFEVIKIKDPIQAIALLFRERPDLILMDIVMPEIDGYQLCRILRKSTALKATPIIMLSGRTSMIDKAWAKMIGADDYLTKPFTKGNLLSTVARHLD